MESKNKAEWEEGGGGGGCGGVFAKLYKEFKNKF